MTWHLLCYQDLAVDDNSFGFDAPWTWDILDFCNVKVVAAGSFNSTLIGKMPLTAE